MEWSGSVHRAVTVQGAGRPTYLAHFESGSESEAPRLEPADAAGLRPEDITGDLVAAFAPPMHQLRLGGRKLRLVVRARAGTCARDAGVFMAG